MRKHMLRRLIVFLGVLFSILILLIKLFVLAFVCCSIIHCSIPHCTLVWSIGKYKHTYQSSRNNNIKDFSIHQDRCEKITLSNPNVHYLFTRARFILHFQSRCIFSIYRRGVSLLLGDPNFICIYSTSILKPGPP